MANNIPYGRQDISNDDIQAVVSVLKSDYLTQGPAVPAFEKALSDYCSVQYAVAMNSATSALHVACLALGLGKGDWLWTSPNTFVASANCALYCGACVDFVDIDATTYNMSVDALAEKLGKAEREGLLPKIVVPVHFAGQSCDMKSIKALADRYGFSIIEDAAHAIGGKYCGEPIGNCRYSDITVFSFHPVKIITTGEGGIAVTNSPDLIKRMRLFHSHGITSDAKDMSVRPEKNIWNYQQVELGYNYRMTDIQAALGLNQMQRLDQFVAKRHAIAECYDKSLAHFPITTPLQDKDNYSSFHLYPIRLSLSEIDKTQRQVYDEMRSCGVLVNLHYIPVYLQPYYEGMGFKAGYCPEVEAYYSEVMSFPMFPTLTDKEQAYVVQSLGEVLNA